MVWGIAGWVEWIRADLRVGVVETRMGWGVFAGWLGLIAGLVWLRLRFCREGKCAGRYIHYHNNVGGRGGNLQEFMWRIRIFMSNMTWVRNRETFV